MGEERYERLSGLLRQVAPGTALREGLENVLRARTGGLIVIGDSPQVMALVDGGFRIDCEFSPASLYELAKMDGAIILSHDLKRILYANATLVPDPALPSGETGIRHRTAERFSRQSGELVIAISQRRNVISLYRGVLRYLLRDTAVILTKANQALQTLERYRSVLDNTLTTLNALELEDQVTVLDVAIALQRAEMLNRVVQEIELFVAELGVEGRLVNMQLAELVAGVSDEAALVLRDYLPGGEGRSAEAVQQAFSALSADELVEPVHAMRILGLGPLEAALTPHGYRLLRKVPRLPLTVVENIANHFGNLQGVLRASADDLDEVEGVGEARARAVRDGLRRLRDLTVLERR